jgi:hypothetical protein
MESADDLLSEEDAKNAPREVMRLVNRMMSSDGDVVSDSYPRCLESGSETDFLFLCAVLASPVHDTRRPEGCGDHKRGLTYFLPVTTSRGFRGPEAQVTDELFTI